jgi:hypothetical protein
MRRKALNTKILARHALTIGAITLFTSCGSVQPPTAQTPAGAPVTPSESASVKGQSLLYVAESTGNVEIVSYPAGTIVSSIDYGLYSYLEAECADRFGNVWITYYDALEEYAHASTKPTAQKSFKWYLSGCSVYPKTSDVAAVGQRGSIFVWNYPGGRVKTYRTKSFYALRHCAYDSQGNLFVDSSDPKKNNGFMLFELPNGGRKFFAVSLNESIGSPGQVQWDGRYLAVQDADAPYDVYRIKVSGTTGRVMSTVAFDGLRAPVKASWISGSAIFVPFSEHGKAADAIGVFNYPGGGEPTNTLRGKKYDYISALALSR